MNDGARTPIAEGLSDFLLSSIAWSDDGMNLILILHPQWAPAASATVECVWATDVRIDLDFGTLMRQALVLDASVENTPDRRHLVRFEFSAPLEGFISVLCNEVHVAETPSEGPAPPDT